MKTILVIDDSDDVRSVIVATLTYAGYAVREAGNGQEGILMVLAQRPDLILCDVSMPVMDGHRTLAAIREFRGTAAIPFILMTGSMGRDEFRHAMVCGADDYLMKPFSAHELIEAVESRLARQTEVQSEALQRTEKQRELDFRNSCLDPHRAVGASGALAMSS
jgi:CheY-like chemotaxis protein